MNMYPNDEEYQSDDETMTLQGAIIPATQDEPNASATASTPPDFIITAEPPQYTRTVLCSAPTSVSTTAALLSRAQQQGGTDSRAQQPLPPPPAITNMHPKTRQRTQYFNLAAIDAEHSQAQSTTSTQDT